MSETGDIGALAVQPQKYGHSQTRSDTIGNLVKALAAAQKEYKPIKRGTENPVYTTEKRKAMYAELCDVIAATQPALTNHGLVVIQTAKTDFEKRSLTVKTALCHESGEWIGSELEIPATQRNKRWNEDLKKNEYYERFDGQTIGAADSYGRRYEYSSIIGVASEPDDDANSLLEQGSKEASKAVGEQKVAEMKARVEGQAQNRPTASPTPAKANPESIGDVVEGLINVKGVEIAKSTNGPYRKIHMITTDNKDLTISAFADHKRRDGSTLFGVLDMLNVLPTPAPCRFRVAHKGKYLNLAGVEKLAGVEYDDDGEPIIQRDEPPPITDEDLPEMFR